MGWKGIGSETDYESKERIRVEKERLQQDQGPGRAETGCRGFCARDQD